MSGPREAVPEPRCATCGLCEGATILHRLVPRVLIDAHYVPTHPFALTGDDVPASESRCEACGHGALLHVEDGCEACRVNGPGYGHAFEMRAKR